MRGIALISLLLAAAGCGKTEPQAPEPSVQRGIDRSVADVRAATAAASGPVDPALSAADLTAKAEGPAKAKS
jgi:hypothetical protein